MDCPRPPELARLAAENPEALAAHLEGCSRCREQMAARTEDDALLGEVCAEREALAAELGYAGPGAIEGYRVHEEVHRGGQGVVYRAE